MRRRSVRIFLLLAIFGLLTTMVPPPPPPPPPGPGEGVIHFSSIQLDPDDPGRRRIGALIFRRGWQLTSQDPRFGGLSAMQIDGKRVIALSDTGIVMEFDLPSPNSPTRAVDFIPVTGHGASAPKSRRDTEAIALHGRKAWVAFENRNMIVRYDRSGWRPEASAQPALLGDWGYNSGAESLARLSEDRFLVIAEGDVDQGVSDIVLFKGDPALAQTAAVRARYRHLPGFRPTDAAALDGNRLLVLNRRFSLFGGVEAKLALIDLNTVRAGAVIAPREIARLRSPFAVDNMEALSIAREGPRIVIRIASDDNFIALQRTLLLEFELDEEAL